MVDEGLLVEVEHAEVDVSEVGSRGIEDFVVVAAGVHGGVEADLVLEGVEG